MTMLIKGGLIHTMTGEGSYVGDILIRGDRIEQVSAHIDPPDDASLCLLEAKGLTILPGLVDAYICDGPETDAALLRSGQAAGVTAGLLWPEQEGSCRIITANTACQSRIFFIEPGNYTDSQLHERFLALANEGFCPACEIGSAKECDRILQTVHSTRVRAILVRLSGCEDMLQAVSLSGCPVTLGVSRGSKLSPWAMAAGLDALGVPVALTCSYPATKLRHLPLCAALCVRDGMDRERALHAITKAPAGLLGLSDAGYIAAGSRADIAIYDGDPLLLATSSVMTISGGKICH